MVHVNDVIIRDSDAFDTNGGAFEIVDSTLNISGSHLAGNSAEKSCGAIAISASSKMSSSLDVYHVIIGSNDAGRDGGGIAVSGPTRLTTERLTMTRNLANLYGGAVSIHGKDSYWSDIASKISSNSAPALYIIDDAIVNLSQHNSH